MRIYKVVILLLLACVPLMGVAQGQITRPVKKTPTTKPVTKPRPKTVTKPTPKPEPKPAPKLTGYISGHEYVDLGLPSGLKWATMNVGASSPSYYGDYYAWGETSPKADYSANTSMTYGKTMADIGGNPSYDAARVNWGGSWRLPTKAEFDELLSRCTWTWTGQGGHYGYMVKGPNGKSIFLPAAGCRYQTSLDYAGKDACYWTSSPYEESNSFSAYCLHFDSGRRRLYYTLRLFGYPVRAVSE